MEIKLSQQTFGFVLLALGIFVAVTGFLSFKRGGRMKPIAFIGLVVVCLGMGAKLAFGPERKPAEVKKVTPIKLPARP
jgi:hypothetical protein